MPYTVLEIRRPTGELIYSRERNAPAAPQVMPPETIADLNSMLHEVVVSGTGRRAQLGFTPQAGKTGTSQNYRDAWFMGFTGHLVTGVWFGNDNFREMRRVTGGLLPAMTWKAFMDVALAGTQPVALLGVPLDESYAKFASAKPETGIALDIPAIPAFGEEEMRSGESSEVVIVEPAQRNDAVVGVFQDMFSLFSSDDSDQSASGSRSGVTVFAPGGQQSERRSRRAAENQQRLKRLLESR
jgi:penicillin-binding protein 1A